MTRSPLPAFRSSFVAGRTVALLGALMMLAIVACTSADKSEKTVLTDPTKSPTATQVTVGTTAPNPTATTTPPTGGNTPLAPTATVAVPPTANPTSKPAEPTATTAPPAATATPKPEPTATPDPFVILVNVITGEVEPNRYPIVAPGDGELLERLFPEAPPYAPHTVDDIQITIDSNKCVTCHGYGLDIGGSVAPQIPVSHYTDALTEIVSEELDPRRYICTSCHVPQVTDPLPFSSE